MNNLAEELRKLQEMHWSGALSDQEFARAKEKLLADSAPLGRVAVEQQLEELQRQNEVTRLDLEWQQERETYMLRGRHGHSYLPTKPMSVMGGFLAVGFGLIWTAFASSVAGRMGEGGPGAFFPPFGVLFILAGIGFSWYAYSRADAFEKAEARYKQRRAELLATRGENGSSP
jgi:hypothetical protein